MDAVSSGVFISATVMLSVAVSVFASDVSVNSFSSYWNVLLSLAVLSTSLIKCITSFKLTELPCISVP